MKSFVVVEFPGYVKNIENALETISPLNKLGSKITDDSYIELNFRPKELGSQAIIGTLNKTANLLLSVKKNKSTHDYHFSIDGTIDYTFKFTGM